MKSIGTSKAFLAAATVASGVLLVAPASAADVSFTPPASPPYLWSSPSNWSSGALPGSGDAVILNDAALATSPVVVPAGTSASVASVTLGSATSGQTGYNLLEIANGASLTTTDTSIGLTVGGATGIVTNYGTFTGRFRLGPQSNSSTANGTLARFDNFGTVSAGAFWMGLGNSKSNTDGTPSIFFNHAGATFGLTGGGYMSRDGGDSTFINEGTMSSSAILYMGLGKGRSELRIQGNGTFAANNEIRLGHGYASTSYIILADDGCITGTGDINVGHGNSTKNATGYLILSNNASIVKSAGVIYLGTVNAGATGYLQMNDSASITHDSYLYVGNSASTRGTVEMAGNSVFQGKTVVLANATNSTGVISLAGNSRFYPQLLFIGGAYSSADNSQATMSLTDSAQAGIGNSLYVGMRPGARGTLSLAGDSQLSVATNLFIGFNSGSTGTVSVAGNAAVVSPSISVGKGTAVAQMTLSDSATLFSTNISIANTGTATGTLEVGGGSVVTNLLAMEIGNSSKCNATLAMRGGAIFLDIDPDNPDYVKNGWFNPIRLNVGQTEACGRIRGWGKVAFSDPVTYVANAAQRPNGLTHHGQVIADGEGVARDLDFSRFGALNFSSTDANSSGTNGWFAVNKGRLRLPRSWPRKSDAAFCVGDHYSLDYSATPGGNVASNRLANTFSATFTGASTGNYIFADLYATDRDDIPAGLAEIHPDRVISVWRIGLFDDGPDADEPETPSSFTSAELRIRIPGAEVAGAEKLYVARHDGTVNGKWTIVGRLANPNPKWPVVPARVSAPSAADWNLGWFAVIDRSTPLATTICFR